MNDFAQVLIANKQLKSLLRTSNPIGGGFLFEAHIPLVSEKVGG